MIYNPGWPDAVSCINQDVLGVMLELVMFQQVSFVLNKKAMDEVQIVHIINDYDCEGICLCGPFQWMEAGVPGSL